MKTRVPVLLCIVLAMLPAIGELFLRQVEIAGATVVYFSIDGHNESEWRMSSVEKVVLAGGPENALAWTTWGATAGWECTDGKISFISVDVPIAVYLPVPEEITLFEISAWNSYFSRLVEHETHHVEIVRAHLEDFQGIKGTACEQAPAKVDKIYSFIGLLNRQFDGLM